MYSVTSSIHDPTDNVSDRTDHTWRFTKENKAGLRDTAFHLGRGQMYMLRVRAGSRLGCQPGQMAERHDHGQGFVKQQCPLRNTRNLFVEVGYATVIIIIDQTASVPELAHPLVDHATLFAFHIIVWIDIFVGDARKKTRQVMKAFCVGMSQSCTQSGERERER